MQLQLHRQYISSPSWKSTAALQLALPRMRENSWYRDTNSFSHHITANMWSNISILRWLQIGSHKESLIELCDAGKLVRHRACSLVKWAPWNNARKVEYGDTITYLKWHFTSWKMPSKIRHSSIRLKLQVYADSKRIESWLTNRAALQIKQSFFSFKCWKRYAGEGSKHANVQIG